MWWSWESTAPGESRQKLLVYEAAEAVYAHA